MSRRARAVSALTLLLFLFAVPRASAGGCQNMAPATSARGDGRVTVRMEKCAFSPAVIHVDEGTEITWANDDPLPHTVTGAGMTLFGTATFEAGDETKPYRFEEPGVYPYACIYHPGMTGAVVVGDANEVAGAASLTALGPAENMRKPPGSDGGNGAAPVAAAVGIATIVLAGALVYRSRRPAVAESH